MGKKSHMKFQLLKTNLTEIEKEEMDMTQKLYTPHRDILIFTTLKPSAKLK